MNSRAFQLPWVGAAVGAGVLVAECAFLLRPVLVGMALGGVGPYLGAALASYVIAGAAADWVVQLASLRAPLPRGVAVAAIFFLVAVIGGEPAAGVAYLVAGAAGWATLAGSRWTWPVAVGVAAWAVGPGVPPSSSPKEVFSVGMAGDARRGDGSAGSPDFLIVVLDTVRRDHTSAYGYRRETTPNLGALAARGAQFERAYTTSNWSLPAHASLFTGMLPARHGAHGDHLELDSRFATLAGLLASRGYQTAGFSANPVVSRGTGLARGFEHFEEIWRPHTMRDALLAWRLPVRFGALDRDKGGRRLVERVLKWHAERDPDRPFFVFANLIEAHAPYQEVPIVHRRAFSSLPLADLELVGHEAYVKQALGPAAAEPDVRHAAPLYDGAIRAADAYLGELVDQLGPRTLVIALSDHGELLGEHELWGHNVGLYEPLIRVPLVIAGPGVPPGRVITNVVSVVDVLPTLIEIAGGSPEEFDGISLRPLLAGDSMRSPRVVEALHTRTDFLTRGWRLLQPFGDLSVIRARRRAAVSGSAKWVVDEKGTVLVYDLAVDPEEEHPIRRSDPTQPFASNEGSTAGPLSALDPVLAHGLRAIGYLR